jgi:Tfp pilus assembly protein PilF
LEFAAKAKALQPSYPDLRNLLGNIYYALGELEKAKEEYSSAMNLAPGRSEFRLNFESVSRKLEPN